MNLHIKNGRLVDPNNNVDATLDVFVADGKIAAIGQAPPGFQAERSIDASGKVVAPGLVDLAVRLREPGFEYRATLESELAAALAGGVTSLCCPPDTDPPLDEPGLVEMLTHRARGLNRAHVHPLGALTVGLRGERLTEMAQLVDAGCVAFSQADTAIVDTQVLLRALQYAATFGYRVWLRPQDGHLTNGGVAHDGEVATRLGLAGIPVIAETIALNTMVELARASAARVHFCRLSSAASIDILRRAKQQGLAVSCDVAAHQLHLCDIDIGFYDSNCNLHPPLRSSRDRQILREALAEGVIDAICSDHTPVDDDAKQVPFAEAEVGASGVELLLPLTLQWASEHGVPLSRALERITARPAAIAGIEAGELGVGRRADICIFDPEQLWRVDAGSLKSQGKNSPFIGHQLRGKVHCTIVSGAVVYEH